MRNGGAMLKDIGMRMQDILVDPVGVKSHLRDGRTAQRIVRGTGSVLNSNSSSLDSSVRSQSYPRIVALFFFRFTLLSFGENGPRRL